MINLTPADKALDNAIAEFRQVVQEKVRARIEFSKEKSSRNEVLEEVRRMFEDVLLNDHMPALELLEKTVYFVKSQDTKEPRLLAMSAIHDVLDILKARGQK